MKPLISFRSAVSSLAAVLSLASVLQPATSPAQRSGERSAGRPAYDQWTTYLNPKYAYQVPVPPGLRAQSDPRKGGGCRFVSDDGSFALKVWGSTLAPQGDDPLEEAWREAINLRGRRVDFQRRSRNGFVLAGSNADGTDFYEKIMLGTTATAGTNVSYPSALATRSASWVDEIERGFVWHRDGGSIVRGDDPPRRGIFGDLRNYFTGEDEEVPSRWSEPIPDSPDRGSRATDGSPGPAETGRDPNKTKIDLTPPEPKPKDRPTAGPLEKPGTSPGSNNTPKPVPAKREDLPFGISIPGKKGYVYSPYVDNKQQVDVTDIPTGTKVKCPYTGKVFRVP